MIEKYRFYFKNEAGNYYTINNGQVTTTSNKTKLNYAPKGWESIVLTWERDFKVGGIFRKFSLPLEFVKDGAKILKHIHPHTLVT